MKKNRTMADIRREYGELHLDKQTVKENPMEQFTCWFNEVLTSTIDDPTAMVLSTVDAQGLPDSRVVLLKGIDEDCFLFYTNYKSAKAEQLASTGYAALNFYWPTMARQVRVRGSVKKTSEESSDAYFATRPLYSQYSAIVSDQSHPVENRQILEDKLQALIAQKLPAIRPDYWGGYKVIPDEYEFWQGRDNRLHDRIRYLRSEDGWKHERLAP